MSEDAIAWSNAPFDRFFAPLEDGQRQREKR